MRDSKKRLWSMEVNSIVSTLLILAFIFGARAIWLQTGTLLTNALFAAFLIWGGSSVVGLLKIIWSQRKPEREEKVQEQ